MIYASILGRVVDDSKFYIFCKITYADFFETKNWLPLIKYSNQLARNKTLRRLMLCYLFFFIISDEITVFGSEIKKLMDSTKPEELKLYPVNNTLIQKLPVLRKEDVKEPSSISALPLIFVKNIEKNLFETDKKKLFKKIFETDNEIYNDLKQLDNEYLSNKQEDLKFYKKMMNLDTWVIYTVVFDACKNKHEAMKLIQCKPEIRLTLKPVIESEEIFNFLANNRSPLKSQSKSNPIDDIEINYISTEDVSVHLFYNLSKNHTLSQIALDLHKLKIPDSEYSFALRPHPDSNKTEFVLSLSNVLTKFLDPINLYKAELISKLRFVKSHQERTPWIFRTLNKSKGIWKYRRLGRDQKKYQIIILHNKKIFNEGFPNELSTQLSKGLFGLADPENRIKNTIELTVVNDDPFQTSINSRECIGCHTSTRTRYVYNFYDAVELATSELPEDYYKWENLNIPQIKKANNIFYEKLDNCYFEEFFKSNDWDIKWKKLLHMKTTRSVSEYDFHNGSAFYHRPSISQRIANDSLVSSVIFSSFL